MGPGVTESLEEDILGCTGTTEQTIIYSELLQEKSWRSWREARTHVQEQKPQQNTQKHSATKVTAPWQVSAADDSLTWGCWIDNLSMGTSLTFSSFWERWEQTFAGEYQIQTQPVQTEQSKLGHLLLLKTCGEI